MARNKFEPDYSQNQALADSHAEPALDDGMVGIVITADHVYLPLDENGNAPIEWRNVPGNVDKLDIDPNAKMDMARKRDCKRVAKRTRLKVPADLAEFLSKRDQAEIV